MCDTRAAAAQVLAAVFPALKDPAAAGAPAAALAAEGAQYLRLVREGLSSPAVAVRQAAMTAAKVRHAVCAAYGSVWKYRQHFQEA